MKPTAPTHTFTREAVNLTGALLQRYSWLSPMSDEHTEIVRGRLAIRANGEQWTDEFAIEYYLAYLGVPDTHRPSYTVVAGGGGLAWIRRPAGMSAAEDTRLEDGPISLQLRADLAGWQDELHRCGPNDDEAPATAWEVFDARGWRLAHRLKREVGVLAKVEYVPLRSRTAYLSEVGSGPTNAIIVFPEQYRHVWAWPSPVYGTALAPLEENGTGI